MKKVKIFNSSKSKIEASNENAIFSINENEDRELHFIKLLDGVDFINISNENENKNLIEFPVWLDFDFFPGGDVISISRCNDKMRVELSEKNKWKMVINDSDSYNEDIKVVIK